MQVTVRRVMAVVTRTGAASRCNVWLVYAVVVMTGLPRLGWFRYDDACRSGPGDVRRGQALFVRVWHGGQG